MNVPPPIPFPVEPKKLDHGSVWQLVLGAVSLVIVIALIVGLAVLGYYSKSSSSDIPFNLDQFTPYLWILGGLQVAVFISLVTAIRKLTGHVSRQIFVDRGQMLAAAVLLVLWGALIYFGSNTSLWDHLGAAEVPVKILSIAAPIYVLISLALYRLQAGSKQRGWALFNATSFVSIVLIIILEVILLIAAVILVGLWLSKKVDLSGYLIALSSGASLGNQDLETLLQRISPYIDANMIVIFCALFFSILVPLVEEMFKPLAVWFLAGRKLTPSEGFAAGVLCGATFGLLESLSMVSVGSVLWQSLVVTRVGTGMLHTLTGGLTGWALASTWNDQKYYRLSLMYAGVVFLHGLWNLFAIFMGLTAAGVPAGSGMVSFLMTNSTWFLSALVAVMLAILLVMNQRLRKELTPPEIPLFSDKLNNSPEQ